MALNGESALADWGSVSTEAFFMLYLSPSKSFALAVLLGASLLAACVENQRGHRQYAYNRCAAIQDRIDRDRDSIDKIEAAGGHRDALRWYREDLVDAKRDLTFCRYGS